MGGLFSVGWGITKPDSTGSSALAETARVCTKSRALVLKGEGQKKSARPCRVPLNTDSFHSPPPNPQYPY